MAEGKIKKPESFAMKDLFLDVSLKTCVNGSSYDFTGKKSFNTTFYRENIGFGITNINIEINPSLQPIVDITFKDLYGNTIFGGMRGKDGSMDTSVLFDWPPPKFIFTFKGYLGRRVTWLLNLKNINTSYVPSDGSYEIKCSFVPNQWGFLADIPFMYLLACKKLRYNLYGSNPIVDGKCHFTNDGIYSFIKVGKQVDIKTQETTKDFDTLSKQLSAIRYNISNALYNTKIVEFNKKISGSINGSQIVNFTDIEIGSFIDKDLTDDNIKSQLNKNDSTTTDNINLFLLSKVKTPSITDPKTFTTIVDLAVSKYTFNDINTTDTLSSPNDKKEKTREQTERVNEILDRNLQLIDDEIKRRIYSSSKSQISKLTIGRVLQQIARDSAFILGYILKAGFDGYHANKLTRNDNPSHDLIGRSFPLIVGSSKEKGKDGEKGEELPALVKYCGTDYGVEKYEMKYIDNFISAIGEGIAENLITDDIASIRSDNKISKRINNLEALQENPYKPFYSNIAENILIRSGIIAYLTRYDDPNKPGDYYASVVHLTGVADDSDRISTLAINDMENLTKDILNQLPFEEKAELKRFCKFFDSLLSKDGEEFNKPYDSQSINDNFNLKTELKSYTTPVSDKIMDYTVIVDDMDAQAKRIFETQLGTSSALSNPSYEMVSGVAKIADQSRKDGAKTTILSLRQVLSKFLKTDDSVGSQGTQFGFYKDINEDQQSFYNTSAINPLTLTAYYVKNNGIYYSYPEVKYGAYFFVLYSNADDASKVDGVMSGPSDVEGKEDKWDTTDFTNSNCREEPLGFVTISTPTKDEGKTTLCRVKTINDYIKKGQVLDYNKLKEFQTTIDEKTGEIKFDSAAYLWPKDKLVQTEDKLKQGELEARNIAYTVYTQQSSGLELGANLAFGPFCDSKRSRNQRVAIKAMCSSILEKLNQVEDEKNAIIGDILGKAAEHKNLIYKQMHTIFQQWSIMSTAGACSGDISDTNNLIQKLENEYGSCDAHINKPVGIENPKLKDVKIADNRNTLFVYDYPLAAVNYDKIQVKDSIINIEPLYKPGTNATILNMVQNICTKNNFIFVPFPGDANSDNINEIYKPYHYENDENSSIRNYFHVIFAPTPETRTRLKQDTKINITDKKDEMKGFHNDAIQIKFGSTNNQTIKGVNVSTDSTKPTAESIMNLQRLVDKENTSKQVAIDCSMLPVYEGRSYKTSIDMIGNAQVYPMQYFFLEDMPMFGGLYQTMHVTHSITTNNMDTKLDGIRMRFTTDGGYGGIPPVTIQSLESLGPPATPISITNAEFATVASEMPAFGLKTSKISDDFLSLIKDIKFKDTSDVDEFFKTNTIYGSFLEFFNATQINNGYFGSFREVAHINAIASPLNANNLLIMDTITTIWGNGGANFFELFSVWCTSLSESRGIPIAEGMSKEGSQHPLMAYAYDKIPNLKHSYNTLDGNKKVSDSLVDPHFQQAFKNYKINKELLGNKTVSSAWAGEQMPKDKKDYYVPHEQNILTHADFYKFRGRGYIQHTGRPVYRQIIKEIIDLPTTNMIIADVRGRWVKTVGKDTEKIATISTNKEWDDLFLRTNGIVASVALKKYYSSIGGLNIDISQGNDIIQKRIFTIGGAPTCGADVVAKGFKKGSIQYEYADKNLGRVMQIANSISKPA